MTVVETARFLRDAEGLMTESGRARVIYFFHNEALPLFLLAMYGKNEKANLSKAERNAMAKLVPALVHGYSKGRGTK